MPTDEKRLRPYRSLMSSDTGMTWLEFALVALLVSVVAMLVLLALPDMIRRG